MRTSKLKDDRSAVRTLARRHPDWSQRRIAREIGRDKTFVYKWIDRDHSDNMSRGRSQCKTVRSESFDKKVKRKMVGSVRVEGGAKRRKLSIRQTVEELNREGNKCSYTTVQASVREIAIYRRRRKRVSLNEKYAKRRFEFAESHLGWGLAQWKKLLNTDSSPFYLKFNYNRQNDGFWCGERDDPPVADTDKFSLKTEVYLGVCAQGVTKPYFVDSPRRVNAEVYSQEILPHFRTQVFERKQDTDDPSTTNLFADEYLFQQDLAPSHWAKMCVTYLREHMQSFMPKDETPPKIFEWPVEQAFNILKSRVYKKGRP